MKAGFDYRAITPDLTRERVELGGFGFFLERYPQQIADDLYVSSLFMEGDNGEKVVLLSLDLQGLDDQTVKKIKESIEEKVGIKPTNSILACTHTHSGPATVDLIGCGKRDQEYVERIIPKIVSSAVRAYQNAGQAAVGFSRVAVNKISYNRTGGNSLDSDLNLLTVQIQNLPPLLALNYACHPVILGSTSRLVSSDFPGAIRTILREREGINTLYTTGCCGDIDPLVRKEKGDAGTTMEDVYNFAQSIVQGVAGNYSESYQSSPINIQVVSSQIELPFNMDFRYDADKEIEQFKARREKGLLGHITVDGFTRYARTVEARINQNNIPLSRTALATAIKVGDHIFLGLPGEIYSSTGLKIKERYPNTTTICYANGDIGYIPPREEFQKPSSYAASAGQLIYNPRPFTEDCEELLLEEVYKILEGLRH